LSSAVATFEKEEDKHHLKLEKSHCIVVLKGVEVVEALGNCPSTKDTTQPPLLLDWSSPLMILAAEGKEDGARFSRPPSTTPTTSSTPLKKE